MESTTTIVVFGLLTRLKLTKSELIHALALKYPELEETLLERLVTLIFLHISKNLALEKRVELRGFGVFSVKYSPAHEARNPRTGEKIFIPGKFKPVFKAGKKLKERINRGV